jgi:hypothetical protein
MVYDDCFLILGGAGLVGSQVTREISREFHPRKVIVAGLTREEVQPVLNELRQEFPGVEYVGAWGDVFVRRDFAALKRWQLLDEPQHREALYADLFGELLGAFARSGLVLLIQRHRPDVIVDCINTATAISYQDVHTLSQETHHLLGRLQAIVEHKDYEALLQFGQDIENNVSTLLISQSIPQLIRHVQMVHQAMSENNTRLYVKIGTTGTGGMGLNIPYTHSEDRPSAKLMSKTAVAFAHTGLMFLMARTPGGPLVKEIKPAAMIGYRQVDYQTIRSHGRVQLRYASSQQSLNTTLRLHDGENDYTSLGELQMAGVDTGENGFFARGEFEAITSMNQMEFITPEEIAHQVVLEIKGSNTGYDIIAGIDSNIMTSSFRAGVLRQTALDKLARIEQERGTHSVALGQLGPPELSKLLYEAHLLKLNYETLQRVENTPATEISETVCSYLLEDEPLRTMITSIGVPILMPDGKRIIRGPRINIPESIYREVPIDKGAIDQWAQKGWVDLRPENFLEWQSRFRRMRRKRHSLHSRGTSSVTMRTYLPETIEIGTVVAWIFNNDHEAYRIK